MIMVRKQLGVLQGMKDFLLGIENDEEQSGVSPAEATRRYEEVAGKTKVPSQQPRPSDEN